jgi:hypothetical protein
LLRPAARGDFGFCHERAAKARCCTSAAERQHYAGRASTLALLRDHILPAESYTLGQSDLRLIEMVAAEPPKPGWVVQHEYEERTSIGFNLERLTKEIGVAAIGWRRHAVHDAHDPAAR